MTATSLPRSLAVLDTNACRDLAENPDRLEDLKKWEWANGVQGFAHPTVAWEILARLGDPEGSARRHLWVGAARALYTHGKSRFLGGHPFCYLLDPETELCRALFDHVPEAHPETISTTFGLLQAIHADDGVLEEESARTLLKGLHHLSVLAEQQWVSDVWDFAVGSQLPNAEPGDWNPYRHHPLLRDEAYRWLRSDMSRSVLARGLVLRAINQTPGLPDDTNVDDLAAWVGRTYEVALGLYAEILARIVGTGCNLSRPHRRNWVWDLEIALCVGRNHRYRGRSMRLITSDGDIVAAARAVGLIERVLPLDEYEHLLRRGRVGD